MFYGARRKHKLTLGDKFREPERGERRRGKSRKRAVGVEAVVLGREAPSWNLKDSFQTSMRHILPLPGSKD